MPTPCGCAHAPDSRHTHSPAGWRCTCTVNSGLIAVAFVMRTGFDDAAAEVGGGRDARDRRDRLARDHRAAQPEPRDARPGFDPASRARGARRARSRIRPRPRRTGSVLRVGGVGRRRRVDVRVHRAARVDVVGTDAQHGRARDLVLAARRAASLRSTAPSGRDGSCARASSSGASGTGRMQLHGHARDERGRTRDRASRTPSRTARSARRRAAPSGSTARARVASARSASRRVRTSPRTRDRIVRHPAHRMRARFPHQQLAGTALRANVPAANSCGVSARREAAEVGEHRRGRLARAAPVASSVRSSRSRRARDRGRAPPCRAVIAGVSTGSFAAEIIRHGTSIVRSAIAAVSSQLRSMFR